MKEHLSSENNQDKKISIIIPVYNVENYIRECLESVINQDYKNLEIILIDDGSKDLSGKICDEYALKDKRIIVIHQKNAGAAAAKNTGLKIATGEYLSFVDADDTLEPNIYSYLVNTMVEYNVDVIQCGFNDWYVNEKKPYFSIKEKIKFEIEDYMKRYTFDWTSGLLWDKLYKRSIFQGIYFEEGNIIDDEYFTYQGIMNANQILFDSVLIYNYRKRKTSVTSMKKNRNRTIVDRLDFMVKRRKTIVKKFPHLQREFDIHLTNMLIWLSKNKYADENTLIMEKEIISTLMKEHVFKSINIILYLQLLFLKIVPVKVLLTSRRNEDDLECQSNYFD